MHWVIKTWRNVSLALSVLIAADGESAPRRIKAESSEGKLVVRAQISGQTGWVDLATYVMETNSRPYLQPVRDPAGKVVLTEDRPADHPWQHGIFTGFHRVNGFNYWKEDEGTQRFVRLLDVKAASDRVSWRALVELVAPDGNVVLEEENTITVHAPESLDAYVIDFDLLLRAKEREVRFGKFFVGGLAVRMPWDKANPRQTHLNSNGLRDRQCEQQRAAWCNVERPFGNETFGIAVFDHPGNPNHPAGWRADEQGLINPNVSALADWMLAANQSQRFSYQLLVYRGAATRDQLAKRFESFGRTSLADETYFPPQESQGGWRKLEAPEEIRREGGIDPDKLADLKQWLLDSDKRDFAAVVIRRGHIVLEVERGNSAKTDSRRVASVSKSICATVLAIASEQSQQGLTPKKMKFDDLAFDFIPWAKPFSDPRKERITVKQLLNHTSGICPEATGAPNDGSWEYILGHSADHRTAKLAFDPGSGCGYSTHALAHAALVCETVTGMPYDQFAIEALLKPIGIEHWWFQSYSGGEKHGRHPSHGMGMPARDLARIAYCMLHDGKWKDQQVIPKWFVNETAAPTHEVKTPEMRWKLNPQIFSHGWELPARLTGEGGRSGSGIPVDARAKPGSGGQYIAFVPSLDLVITRQTGSSGEWQFEEYLRRACAAIGGIRERR